jgi:D-alanyl-D-alanine carboxypeptidase (penicillin-binding protein 5/6)
MNPIRTWAVGSNPPETQLLPITKKVTLPVLKTDKPEAPELTASAVYVMDRGSGSVLFHLSPDQARYPASTAKLMTALVARQIYPPEKVLTIQENYLEGSTTHLTAGEKMSVRNLLFALLLPSANDAAVALADNHPQKAAGFMAQMNQTAKKLHLDQTTFFNPSGLDASTQQSTARDLAILANEVMKDPLLREIVSTKETGITDTTGQLIHQLSNTNELLGKVPGVVGIKTGTTDFAGENLITERDKDGHQLIFVVLGSTDRYADTRKLYDWVDKNYDWKEVERVSE